MGSSVDPIHVIDEECRVSEPNRFADSEGVKDKGDEKESVFFE